MISTKELLYSKYQSVFLKFCHCSQELNVTERHLYNLHSDNKLPFPIIKYGKLCRVHIEDFAIFLDSLRQPKKKCRGRPSKAQLIARAQADLVTPQPILQSTLAHTPEHRLSNEGHNTSSNSKIDGGAK